MIGGLGISQLATLANGAYTAVWHRPVETHPVAIKAFQKWLRFPSRRFHRLAFAAACIASSGPLLPPASSSEKE